MAFSVSYKSTVEDDLRRLDKPVARRILQKIETDLAKDPARGIAMQGEFQGLFRYRVGDYRIVYARVADGILVLRIRHRKDVYRHL